MELLQLRYFQAVARTENITRAAQELHIAQPSLSKTIGRLEEQVGTPLFDRRGKRLALNEAGRRFLTHVDQSLQELDNGLQELRDLSKNEDRRVTLASATAKFLPGMIQAYLTEHPDTRLRFLQVMQHAELLRQLEQGDSDLCISTLPLNRPGICCRELVTEQIFLAVPPGHPFSEKHSISLSEVGSQPLILYTAECGLRETLQQYFDRLHFTPNLSCECTTSEVSCGLVRSRVGLAFLPEYLMQTESARGLVSLPFVDPPLTRSIWIAWNEKRYLSQRVQSFRDYAIQHFQAPR